MPILPVMQDFTPFSGVRNVSGVPADAGGRNQERRPPNRKATKSTAQERPDTAATGDDYPPAPMEEPTAALVEALDRLRATQALSPAEETTRRLLRGKRYYHERKRPSGDDLDALFREP